MIRFGEEKRVYNLNRPQYKAIKYLPDFPGKVIDVGAGLGEFGDMLRRHKIEPMLIDGNEDFMESTRKRGFTSYVCDFENERFPFNDNTFNVAIMLDVIEHIWNRYLFFNEVKRILKNNGLLIVSTINYNYWRYRWLHLLGNHEKYTRDTRYKRLYTLNTFKDFIGDYFEIQDVIVDSFFPNLLSQKVFIKARKI